MHSSDNTLHQTLGAAFRNSSEKFKPILQHEHYAALQTGNQFCTIVSNSDISALAHARQLSQGLRLNFPALAEAYLLVILGKELNFELSSKSQRISLKNEVIQGLCSIRIDKNTDFTLKLFSPAELSVNLLLIKTSTYYKSILDHSFSNQKWIKFSDYHHDSKWMNTIDKLKLVYFQRTEATYMNSLVFTLKADYFLEVMAQGEAASNAFYHRHLDKVCEAVQILDKGLNDYTSVTDLAVKVGLSKDALQNSFKRFFGASVNQFVQYKRLEQSIVLLITTDLAISQIMKSLGLNSRGYFSELFKTYTGMPASEFRSLYRPSYLSH